MLFPKVFWNDTAHFLRPVAGNYTFANNHALGVKNVLCAWIRPAAVDKVTGDLFACVTKTPNTSAAVLYYYVAEGLWWNVFC